MASKRTILPAPGPEGCICAICLSIDNVRRALHEVHAEQIFERQVLYRLESAAKLMEEAHNIIRHAHDSQENDKNGAEGEDSSKTSQSKAKTSSVPLIILSSGENDGSPVHGHSRHVTNPWQMMPDGTSSWRVVEPQQDFQTVIRGRAAELGILRQEPLASDRPIPTIPSITDTKTPIKEQSKFIVCDHCRSHGIRCNEASICKECVLRQVPCIHRKCDLSPNSRDSCPRHVCFYVHDDWMPDLYGVHDPDDKDWIVLPGKLRDHCSAGKLSRIHGTRQEESSEIYRGAAVRQQDAVKMMDKCVQAGLATWETVAMQCNCIDTERKEAQTHASNQIMRQLALAPNTA